MKIEEKPEPQSRREFLKQAGCMGALMCLAANRLFSSSKANLATLSRKQGHAFQYRTVSVRHIPELKAWMDKLDKAGRLSANKTWRSYIDSFQYAPPKTLANARSLIVMSTPLKIAKIVFNIAGQKHTVMIPAGYVDDGLRLADYQNMLFNNGIVAKGSKLELARLPLKQLAVRSGLAEYGKNNITFVDGYGSYPPIAGLLHRAAPGRPLGPAEDAAPVQGLLHLPERMSHPGHPRKRFHHRSGPLHHPVQRTPRSHAGLDPGLGPQRPGRLPEMPVHLPGRRGCDQRLLGPGRSQRSRDRRSFWSGRIDAETERSLRAKLKRIGGGDNLPYIARNLKLVLNARVGR